MTEIKGWTWRVLCSETLRKVVLHVCCVFPMACLRCTVTSCVSESNNKRLLRAITHHLPLIRHFFWFNESSSASLLAQPFIKCDLRRFNCKFCKRVKPIVKGYFRKKVRRVFGNHEDGLQDKDERQPIKTCCLIRDQHVADHHHYTLGEM